MEKAGIGWFVDGRFQMRPARACDRVSMQLFPDDVMVGVRFFCILLSWHRLALCELRCLFLALATGIEAPAVRL